MKKTLESTKYKRIVKESKSKILGEIKEKDLPSLNEDQRNYFKKNDEWKKSSFNALQFIGGPSK